MLLGCDIARHMPAHLQLHRAHQVNEAPLHTTSVAYSPHCLQPRPFHLLNNDVCFRSIRG